jgi:hypothetical protein
MSLPEPEIKKIKLAWLAGIMDGEGSFGMRRGRNKKNPNVFYNPQTQIVNCNFDMLDEIKSILRFYKIKFSFDIRKDTRKANWSDSGRIALTNLDGNIKFIELIIPFMIAKKPQAKILLEFCKKRKLVDHKSRHLNGNFIKTYDGSEEKVFLELHKLNKKGRKI